MKHRIDFLSTQQNGIRRFKFVSDVTGGIRYCEIDFDNKTYTTDYYRYNGGWHISELVPLWHVRAAVKWCEEHGYQNID